MLTTILWLSAGRDGRAEPSAGPLPSSADLDGIYLAIGPSAELLRSEGAWDGAFGGELALVRVREAAPVGALGLAVGALDFTERDGARAWAEVLVGTKRLTGFGLGASVGGAFEADRVRPLRPGWQVTVWAYAGVMPYARAGSLRDTGGFFEIGLKIPLPALRWRR